MAVVGKLIKRSQLRTFSPNAPSSLLPPPPPPSPPPSIPTPTQNYVLAPSSESLHQLESVGWRDDASSLK